MEPDTEYALCYPPHPAFTRICEILAVALGRNGADHMIGRRVPELFRQAGCRISGWRPRRRCTRQATPGGRSRSTWCGACAQIREMGLASEAELNELDAAARAHLDDPHTVAMFGLLFLVWGRKPAGSAA
jgi:hypothetical protein